MRRSFFIFFIPFILLSCASSKKAEPDIVPLEVAVDERLPSMLEKSKFQIVVEETELYPEHAYTIGLFYEDIMIPFKIVAWKTNQNDIIDFKYFDDMDYLFCLDAGEAEIIAEFNSLKITKKIMILPSRMHSKFKIIEDSDADCSVGRVVPYFCEYNEKDVTADANWSFYKNTNDDSPILLSRLEKYGCRAFCLNEGVVYIVAYYRNQVIFKVLKIAAKNTKLSIRVPENAVFKPGNSVAFSAYYEGKDVTKETDWNFSYLKSDEFPNATSEGGKNGEVNILAEGFVYVVAKYNGENTFFTFESSY